MYFHYVILKKNKEFLAVLTNANTQWELGHYHDQGYIFLMEVSAFSASGAIEMARQNENSEIVRLQSELNALRQEYQKLLNENNDLKFNKKFNSPFGVNNLNPFEVLGCNKICDEQEIKKRYRQLAQKLHPDKEGSNFLMQIVQNAYEQIKASRS